MDRRAFIRTTGGGVVLAALGTSLSACSSRLPAEALAAWQEAERETDPRRWILAHALLAPHSHNLQSWLVDISRPDEITLFVDRKRLLPETDPFGRQILMSQGTFLELLHQAAKQKGLRADITLFPEGIFSAQQVDERPTAHIRLVRDEAVRPEPLFAQILKRRTNREAYEMRVPPQKSLQAIVNSSYPYLLITSFATQNDPPFMQQHRRIAKEAWRIELSTPRTVLESMKWLRIGPSEIARHRDGLSNNELILRLANTFGWFDRTKAPKAQDRAILKQIEKFNKNIDSTPAFYWLLSTDNERTTQINAGRAWVRAQLAATAEGLSMQPISQALQEYPEMQGMYQEIYRLLTANQGLTVQMWSRLGYAPQIEPAPRRGLSAHLLKT
jgi:hypothetical protein